MAPLVTVAVVLVLLFMAGFLTGTSAPSVPKGVFHDSVLNDKGCITCHTPGRQAPLRRNHTEERTCLACHDHHVAPTSPAADRDEEKGVRNGTG